MFAQVSSNNQPRHARHGRPVFGIASIQQALVSSLNHGYKMIFPSEEKETHQEVISTESESVDNVMLNLDYLRSSAMPRFAHILIHKKARIAPISAFIIGRSYSMAETSSSTKSKATNLSATPQKSVLPSLSDLTDSTFDTETTDEAVSRRAQLLYHEGIYVSEEDKLSQ